MANRQNGRSAVRSSVGRHPTVSREQLQPLQSRTHRRYDPGRGSRRRLLGLIRQRRRLTCEGIESNPMTPPTPRRSLFLGPSAATRRERARERVEELLSQNSLLLLSEEQESAGHFLRETAFEQGSLFGAHRMTLDALAYRLALPRPGEARDGIA